MKTDIEGARAIVTGGALGIGFQLCRQLLLNGAKTVAILDINESAGLKSMKQLNNEFGQGRIIFVTTNVADIKQFEESFMKAVEQMGGLEIMINNAGILNYPRWYLMVDVNVKGVIHGTLLGINYMGKHKGGKGGIVINIGSIAAFSVVNLIPIYSATKAAIVAFSRQMGSPYHYERTGVAVKVMCPGRVDTDMIPQTTSPFLDYIQQEDLGEVERLPGLKPEELAPDVMKLIKDPSTNAAWVKINGEPTCALKFINFTDMLTPIESIDK
ncbi:15-hydroxyprostaglandin dehydrogenase [NAD(+)]-like [Chelonus insularis]|uniref:15-hydroxyprostaglandin dehydrogenase [NAD(+)]-like n=1 Tax=Chelonus insularis TaxID=460826 RepID=UPI00158D8678|nr:15-hydroxyprostaglandin dehydrogenase [NAD(+)]-like [Chelonus insularis]XP_034945542.1 15-hydroxyprostaglandin dehydrogenase [NAD(+)]-like [Chelonus insularis]XP_034945543.1 15-hydroxyprostaglandin dehydrogenase [NAD(+)]-like [Chelonus insularis]